MHFNQWTSRLNWATVGIVLLFLGVVVPSSKPLYAAEAAERLLVRSLEIPGGRNTLYPANRAPLRMNPFIKLPAGSIRPAGWLRRQLELQAEGFYGHLGEISRYCDFSKSAWANKFGEGQYEWEELPYWLRGMTALGHALEHPTIIAESQKWINAILSSQRDNGYFGPQANYEDRDIWPNMLVLVALRTHYEATGDERIPPFMSKYFAWLASLPESDLLRQVEMPIDAPFYAPFYGRQKRIRRLRNQKWRGGDNLDSIYWLYNRTGDENLLSLARSNHRKTEDWVSDIPVWFGVDICQGFREPAQFYRQDQDEELWRAVRRNYATVMNTYGQFAGGMFAADQRARSGYIGPRQASEACMVVEMIRSTLMLTEMGGSTDWAERAERVALNTLPATMTPDLKGLHRLTAPNQIQLDRKDKTPLLGYSGDVFSYTGERNRCCQHNVGFAWPTYSEYLWMATGGNGLAAVQYAPCRVKAKLGDNVEAQIDERTDYPFGESVEFKLTLPKPAAFPLLLRIPTWCRSPKIQVNGQECRGPVSAGAWLQIERTWNDGDAVRLELPMVVAVSVWRKNANSVSISRGPLEYSLKVGEKWERYGGSDAWPAFEVLPTTAWNYALVVDARHPNAYIEEVRKAGPVASQPFTPEDAPIQLQAKARKIPTWTQEINGLIGSLPSSPIRSNEPIEEVTLIPMGCARLRVTSFPQMSK